MKKRKLLGLAFGASVVAMGATGSARAEAPEEAEEPAEETEAKEPRPPACEEDLELVGLVYVPKDPARSLIMVGDKGSRLVRVGETIQGRKVLDVGPRTVYLGPSEDPCVERLTERNTRKPARRRRRGRSRRR